MVIRGKMKELEFMKKVVKSAYKKHIKNKQKNTEVKVGTNFLTDLVTDCDKKVELYITNKIKKLFPNDTIIGEEFSNSNAMQGRCWLLDPIDGTVNFAKNLTMWCIQMAFVDNGVAKASVVYVPTHDKLYYADEKGSYLNGKRLFIDATCNFENSIVNMCDFYQCDKVLGDFQLFIISQLYNKVMKIKMLGSAGYEMAQVADNQAQAYLLISNNPWDIVPGEFIAKMAGAKIIHSKISNKKLTIACNNDKMEKTIKQLIKQFKSN